MHTHTLTHTHSHKYTCTHMGDACTQHANIHTHTCVHTTHTYTTQYITHAHTHTTHTCIHVVSMNYNSDFSEVVDYVFLDDSVCLVEFDTSAEGIVESSIMRWPNYDEQLEKAWLKDKHHWPYPPSP